MTSSGETFKHSPRPIEEYRDETLSTTTHEPPVIDPVWKVTRFLETVIVSGRTQTQAYENAAALDGISLPNYFSVPVYAVKLGEVQPSNKIVAVEDPQEESPPEDPAPDFELPPYMD